MANDFEFDEFDDFGDDFDDGVKSSDGRKATGALADGATSFKEHFLDKANMGDRLKNTSKGIFKGFVGDSNASAISGLSDDFSSEIEKSVNELKKDMRPIATALKKIAPKDGVLGKMSDKVIKAISLDSDSSGSVSEEQVLNNKVNSALDGLKYIRDEQNRKEDLAKDMLRFKQMNNQITLLQSIANSVSNFDKFTQTASSEFYKKSLELQYRQVFLTTDIKSILALGFDRLAKEQDIIAKNTALPDFVKLRSSEAMKQIARNKIANMFTDKLFSQNSVIDSIKINALGRIRNNINDVKSYVGTINDFIEAGGEINEVMNEAEENGMSKGSIAGMQVADATEKMGNSLLGKFLAKSPLARKLTTNVSHAMISGGDYLNGIAENKKGTFLGSIAAYIRDLTRDPSLNGETSIADDNLNDSVVFDKRTHLSITKVIPGFLAKILQSIERLRTGKLVSEQMYDYEKDKFTSKRNFKKILDQDLGKNIYNSGLTNSIKSAVGKLLSENKSIKLTAKEKQMLISNLYLYASEDGSSMNPEYLEKHGFYKMFPKETRGKIKALFKGFIYTDNEVDLDKLDSLTYSMRNIKSNIHSPRTLLLKHKDNGNTEQLVKLGILEFDNNTGEYKINMKNYHKYASKLVFGTTTDTFEKFMNNETFNPNINKKNYTTLKDVYKQGKKSFEELDKEDLKNKFIDKKNEAVSKLKAFDEKVSKMTKEDFKKLGAETKEDAIKKLNEIYEGNIPEEHRKKIDKHLNRVFNSKGYGYAESKINTTIDYVKKTNADKLKSDLNYVRKKLVIRFNRVSKLIKDTSKDDLYALGLTSRKKAFDYFSELYGKTDIKTLKRIEKEISKKYDKFDIDEAKKYFEDVKKNVENTAKGIYKKSEAKVKNLEFYIKSMKKQDFQELGIETPNEALNYIVKNNNDLTQKDIKKLYKFLTKLFDAKDKVETTKGFFSNLFSSGKQKAQATKKQLEEQSTTLAEALGKFFKKKEKDDAKKSSFFDSDGDGYRNNSWQERLSAKFTKKDAKIEDVHKEVKKNKIGGLVGLLISTLGLGFSGITGLLGGLTNTVGSVFSILETIGRFTGSIAKGLGVPLLRAGWWMAGKAGNFAWETAKTLPGTIGKTKDILVNSAKVTKDIVKGVVLDPIGMLKKLFTSSGMKAFGALGAVTAIYYLADNMSGGKLTEGINDMEKGIGKLISSMNDKISDMFHSLSDYSESDIANATKNKEDLDKVILEASEEGLFERVDQTKFSDMYKHAIRELEIEIIMTNARLEHTRNRSTISRAKKKIKELVKTRKDLIKKAREEAKVTAKENKVKEDKDKIAAKKRQEFLNNKSKNIAIISNKITVLQKKLSNAKTPEERDRIQKEIDKLNNDRTQAAKDYASFASKTNKLSNEEFVKTYIDKTKIEPKAVATKVSVTKDNTVVKPNMTKKDIDSSANSMKDIKPGTTEVLKGPFKIAGYIIRMVESRNNYGVSGIVKGESFVSFGAYQFTEKSGSLVKTLRLLVSMSPDYKDELLQHLSKFKGVWYRGSRAELSGFLARIGPDKKAKEAQDKMFYALYAKPAYNEYKKLGIDNQLLLVHMIDHYHNTGKLKTFISLYKSTHNIVESRLAVYRSFKKWYKYGKGWTNRVHTTDALARKYIGNDNIPEDTSTAKVNGDFNVNKSENSNTEDSNSGIGSGLKLAVKAILEFFGIKEEPDSIRSSSDINNVGSSNNNLSEDNSEMKKNNATKFNPVINDYATEMRYNSLNDTAKEFFSKFSHYALSHGIRLMIPKYGGNRSMQNQKDLYAIGRSKPGKIITKTLKSKHRGGRAIDIISSKGFSAVKENHQIALMMRSFANDNPELGASFIDMKWDPNHVEFRNSKPIKEIDVESEILHGGKHIDDKEVAKKYEENLKKNPVTGNKFTKSLGSKKLTMNNHMMTDIATKTSTTTVDSNPIKLPVVKQQPVMTRSISLIPEIKNEIQSIKTQIPSTVSHKVDIYDQYAEQKFTVLTSMDQTLKDILETNTNILRTLGGTQTVSKQKQKKKIIPEPLISVRR